MKDRAIEVQPHSHRETLIIAPHPDDEIIGCYEILKDTSLSIGILYAGTTEGKRREEAVKLRNHIGNIKAQLFQHTIPTSLINENTTFYFPDPIYEVHPDHRQWGFIGESLARGGMDVIFYSVIMSAPYIHRLADKADEKEELLNKVYPSQKDLWKYDKKYVLFEGRCKWMF